MKQGILYNWEESFEIEVEAIDKVIVIKANKAGLISLANHLQELAEDAIPIGYHLHLDEYNSLEDGSLELVIEKK